MKNFIQFLKNIFIASLLAAILIPVGVGMHAQAQTPEISAEDLKLLEEITKEVDNYVNSLPTRDQLRAQGLSESEVLKRETKEKFQEQVERYSKMSEEELLAEMEAAFAEAKAALPEVPQESIPEPIELPVIEKEQPIQEMPAKAVIPSNKQQAALQLIDGLILTIRNFLQKAQIMSELPGKIVSWNKEGKLKGVPVTFSWTTFKASIEELESKLNKIKDKDPRSQQYKYLDEFIKDESLYNNVSKVKDSLSRSEPKIVLSSFGIDKMTSSARQATRDVLLQLYEATHILAIPSALDKLIEKYEPTAKKIKESEEAAQKRATEESRRTRMIGGTTVGGTPRSEYEGFKFPTDYDRGISSAPKFESAKPEKPSDLAEKAKTPTEQAAKGAEGKKPEDKKAETPKRETDKKADAFEDNFLKALDVIQDTLADHLELKDLEKHIKDQKTFVDEELMEAIKTINGAARQAQSAVRKMKNQLGKLNPNQKKEYRKSMKDDYKDAKSSVEKLIEQINAILKPTRSSIFAPLTTEQQYNTKAKYYSYVNKEYADDLEKYVEATKKKAAQPSAPQQVSSPQPDGAQQAGNQQPSQQPSGAQPATQQLSAQAKKIDNLLTKGNSVNIEELRKNLQELKKLVDEL